MTATDSRATARIAYLEWTEHRFYAYRGCAPDTDDPRRAAGNPELSLDAWCGGEDRDGAASQKERRAQDAAALEVCLGCPVMVACDRYANSVTPEGKLAEPDGIRGGRTALERHRAFIARRHEVAVAAPDRRFDTPQKRAVLAALAVRWDAVEVAVEASRLLALWGEGPVGGMDVRTANWQRSVLVTLLNLNKQTATRREVLAQAVRRGLVSASVVVDDDGTVPAVPPPTSAPSQDHPAVGLPAGPRPQPSVLVLGEVSTAADAGGGAREPGPGPDPGAGPGGAGPVAARAEVVPYQPVHVPMPDRRRFTYIAGQLALWEAELADVHPLFPARPLEAAA